MKRISLLMLAAGMLLALTAGVAVAKAVNGTNGPDVLRGTAQDDVIKAAGGNDRLYGLERNDQLYAGTGDDKAYGSDGNDLLAGHPGNDLLSGGTGNDRLFGGPGGDRLFGSPGNDLLVAGSDRNIDYVFCGSGTDTARITVNDIVDGTVSGQSLLDGVNTVTSCETIFVNDIRVTNPLTTK